VLPQILGWLFKEKKNVLTWLISHITLNRELERESGYGEIGKREEQGGSGREKVTKLFAGGRTSEIRLRR